MKILTLMGSNINWSSIWNVRAEWLAMLLLKVKGEVLNTSFTMRLAEWVELVFLRPNEFTELRKYSLNTKTPKLPVIAAPPFIISVPELVIAQCKAGVIGSFPVECRKKRGLTNWKSTKNH